MCHDADPRVGAFGTDDRHDPRKSIRRDRASEMQLDVPEVTRRQLSLGRMQVGLRQPETEPALEAVTRAAREHDQARVHACVADGRADIAGARLEARDARADAHRCAGGRGASGERAIELEAIDHRRQRRRRGVVDRQAGG